MVIQGLRTALPSGPTRVASASLLLTLRQKQVQSPKRYDDGQYEKYETFVKVEVSILKMTTMWPR
jgi:hypothetical protein